MPKRASLIGKLPYILIAFVICSAGLSTSYLLSHARQSKQETKPSINNQTRAIEVVDAKILDDSLHLSVKNSSSKNITWLKLSIGEMGLEAEFTYAAHPLIAPGEVYAQVFATNPGLATKGISIISVLFDDGTSEGDQLFVKQIKERRQGEKTQLMHILNLLETKRTSFGMREASASLDELSTEITNLQEGQKENLPENVRLGHSSGKAQALKFIRELQNQNQLRGIPADEALTTLKKKYQEIISRL